MPPQTALDTAELRRSVRGFLASRFPLSHARDALHPAAADAGHDRQWNDLGRQGLLGLHVPEILGGQGGGMVELGVAVQEAGRALVGGYLSSVAAVAALLPSPGAVELVRGAVAGSLRCALALPPGASGLGCTAAAGEVRVTGGVDVVADALLADVLVVAADAPGGGAVLVAVPCGPAVHREALTALDGTRPVARVHFDGAPGQVAGGDAAVRRAVDVWATLIAAECTGVAARCLDTAVAHTTARVAFGSPLASFQAVKHRCATMYALVESCDALAESAARALQDGDPGASAAASMACALAVDTGVHAATESLLLHGGLGFTWEHDAHLLLRRARANQALSGGAAWHRRRLLDHLDTPEDRPPP